jgi:hypothetical protein
VVPADWVAAATTRQATTPAGYGEDYGYGWWVPKTDEEMAFFAAEGRDGQRILIVPPLDVVVVMTGGGLDYTRADVILGNAATDGWEPQEADPAADQELETALTELVAAPPPEAVPPLPAIAETISGRTFRFTPATLLRSLRLDFDAPDAARVTVDVISEPEPRVGLVGLDGNWRPSLAGHPIASRGSWQDDSTFVIDCSEGPGLTAYRMVMSFIGDEVRLEVAGQTVIGTAAP